MLLVEKEEIIQMHLEAQAEEEEELLSITFPVLIAELLQQ